MRHKKSFNHLSRKAAHRNAMLANMASSLIKHKRITTTVAKAKALRVFVEPIITKSKVDSTHSRRVAFSYLRDKDAVTELFRNISVKVADRPGGYTRILKTGSRLGDNAEMCMIELVDFNELMLGKKATEARKTTRRGRSGAKKAADAKPETAKVEAKKESKPEAKVEEKVEAKVEETPTEPTTETENEQNV